MGYFEVLLEEEREKLAPRKILLNLCDKLREEEISVSIIKRDKAVVELPEGNMEIALGRGPLGGTFYIQTRSKKWGFGDFGMIDYADNGDVQHVMEAVKNQLRRLAKHIAEEE